jgi:hypothetical protein
LDRWRNFAISLADLSASQWPQSPTLNSAKQT